MALGGMAAIFFLVEWLPSLSPYYGFYSDELYYLACADRPALGYVDHPPLFVWLLGLHREVFGDSQLALRTLPAAIGALTVFLTGWMAHRLGGGPFAQALAALAVMVSGVSLLLFSFFTVNCTAILLWTLASWVLVELCRSRDPRFWLPLGAMLGLALLNKHTAAVAVTGVVVGTLLSPLRADLRRPWPWIGALAAALIVSPNLYWQIANGWPSLEFYRQVELGRYTASWLQQLEVQILAQNPLNLPVWACGLWFLLFSGRGSRFRPLGWLFATAWILAVAGGSMLPYRIAGIYPVAFAGGAVLLECLRGEGGGRMSRLLVTYALPCLMLLVGGLIASFALPILPPAQLERHPLYDADEGGDFRPEIGRNRIPYHLGNRTHWRSVVAAVGRVVEGLEPSERAEAIILADYFGHAGALEHYARERLPPVYSPMTGYFLWGPPEEGKGTVISIGIDERFIEDNFEYVRVADIFRCTFCPPVVDELPILVATRPRRPWAELWPAVGRLEDRRARMLRAQRRRE